MNRFSILALCAVMAFAGGADAGRAGRVGRTNRRGPSARGPYPVFTIQPRPVAAIHLEGAIDVPTAEYLERGLQVAQKEGAQCLIIFLSTPGGLGEPMLRMTKALLNSPLPTVIYVYPAGGFAISAGTYITLSANIAAMHPATTIGGAHPVNLFSMPESGEQGGEKGGGATGRAADVSMEKITNAFAEQAKVIAKTRGRNVEWADQAVRESKVVSAEEALKLGVVEIIADSPGDLLRQLDGREVTVAGGAEVVLHTKGATMREIPPSLRERFLHNLANPDLLLILLVLAGMGIMFELKSPGAILPGVVGGICLLLALYSMSALPVSSAGVGLILFGMLLLLAELKVPSHGILTVGGVISFVLGGLLLMDTSVAPAIRTSWQVVVVMGVLLVLFFLFIVGASIRAHRRRVGTGGEGLRQARGRALGLLAPVGEVLVEGERWRARAESGSIAADEEIEVVGRDGLTLLVRKKPVERATGASS